MISPGNSKLGAIPNFSLEAVKTCPGASEACKSICYATSGFYNMPSVQAFYERNLKLARSMKFVDKILEEIQKRQIRLMRIHASGDFETPAYASKWLEIITRSKHTRFFAYTRSWREEAIRPILWDMSRRSNMSLLLSCDHETGAPPRWHKVRIAYMATSDDDSPKFPVDLVFRDQTQTPMIREPLSGALVCPVEQGVERSVKITCEKCRLCFDKKRQLIARPGVNERARVKKLSKA